MYWAAKTVAMWVDWMGVPRAVHWADGSAAHWAVMLVALMVELSAARLVALWDTVLDVNLVVHSAVD